MKNALRLVTMLAAGLAVSGCGSVFGGERNFARAPSAEVATPAGHLAAGKRYLDQGLTSLAVAEFRLAQQGGDTLAEASNGLGVAYARVGRADLAERYFRMAASVAPADTRYAANLARLYRSSAPALAERSEPVIRMALPQVQASPANSLAAKPAGATGVTGRIERLSRGEVRIRTADVPASAPRAAVVMLHSAPPAKASQVNGGPAPEADGAPSTGRGNGYPKRIVLAP